MRELVLALCILHPTMDRNIPTYPLKTKPKLGTYEIDRTIGKGIFSLVKLATHTITGLQLAIKIIDKTRLDAENLHKINREAEILKKLHHPHIVKLFQVMETPRLLCLVMEYLPNGEVFDYITTHGRFPEAKARSHFFDLLSAIDYAHSCGVVHRDLKAENLLFDSNMKIKLIDFSFGTQYSGALLTTWCGSPPYAAPEIFNGEPYVGTKADIWSLGVLLYVMVCGTLPFDAQPLPDLKNQVLSANFRVPYWLSTSCEHLLRTMMAKSPSKRPTAREISQHPWFTQPLPKAAPSLLFHPPFPHPDDSCECVSQGASTAMGSNRLYPDIHSSYCIHGKQQLDHQDSLPRPPHSRCSLAEHGSDLAADLEMGKIDELPILLMESYGMNRAQILESLTRKAYDHLMATYLLLGEKLRSRRLGLTVLPTLDRLSSSAPNKPLFESPSGPQQKRSHDDSAVDMKFSPSGCESDALSIPSECHGLGAESSQAAWSGDPSSPVIAAQLTRWGLPVPEPSLYSLPLSHSPVGSPIALPIDNVANCPTSAAPSSCPETVSTMQPLPITTQTPSHPLVTSDRRDDSDQSHQVAVPWFTSCAGVTSELEPVQPTNVVHDPPRRGLVRRKYGVVTPPACLDQLAQVVLTQQSLNEESVREVDE
ncbi:unnamed protein product [Dicrocoelium dendriticum]|nr:unnamed protein product [Dicrocoelium dendriticum]